MLLSLRQRPQTEVKIRQKNGGADFDHSPYDGHYVSSK